MYVPGVGVRYTNVERCYGERSTAIAAAGATDAQSRASKDEEAVQEGVEGSQPAVYEGAARDAVLACLNGFSACLLCYGQTGSGKTYTIFGPDGVLRQLDDAIGSGGTASGACDARGRSGASSRPGRCAVRGRAARIAR